MSRHIWVIVLLLTFAVASASRQPSAASTSTPASSLFPGLPPLPPLPALPPLQPLPALPPLPPFPPFPPLPSPGTTTRPPPPPTECLTSFVELLPCVDYLTNATAPAAPPSDCCDGFRSLVGGSALICLCHGINGDMSRFLSMPIVPVRMVLLPAMCSTVLPPQSLFMCYTEPVPPLCPLGLW